MRRSWNKAGCARWGWGRRNEIGSFAFGSHVTVRCFNVALSKSIERAKEFGIWLHERANDRNIPSGLRERTGAKILQHSLDIDDAILILLDAQLPGPALTLVRPLFESYVRGVWLLQISSDNEIEEFINGKCPTFYELLEAIGNDQQSGGAWIHANKNANWSSFNDLTHGGNQHVKRRNTQEAIEPNYPESELEALIRFGIEVRIRIGCILLSLMNDEVATGQLSEKANSLRISP